MDMSAIIIVEPGSYIAEEIVPAGWILTNITCDDANSTVDIPGKTATFNIESGEDVKCTFENSVDTDGDGIPDSIDPDDDNDGIYDDIDSLPTVFSQFFSDGISSGTITSGQQFLTITDVLGPGINIVSTGAASVDACGISSITFTAGEVKTICGSITIEIISGSSVIVYTAEDGTTTTSTLNAGDSVTYEDTQSGEITNNGSEEISISVNGGEPISVGVGETIPIEPTTLTVQ